MVTGNYPLFLCFLCARMVFRFQRMYGLRINFRCRFRHQCHAPEPHFQTLMLLISVLLHVWVLFDWTVWCFCFFSVWSLHVVFALCFICQIPVNSVISQPWMCFILWMNTQTKFMYIFLSVYFIKYTVLFFRFNYFSPGIYIYIYLKLLFGKKKTGFVSEEEKLYC